MTRFGRAKKNQPADPVSVNARLLRMALPDLIDYAEVEIMTAGHELSMWREARVIDPSHIDQAVMHAEWALEGLRAIQQRDRPGLA